MNIKLIMLKEARHKRTHSEQFIYIKFKKTLTIVIDSGLVVAQQEAGEGKQRGMRKFGEVIDNSLS